ncbi:hypothetical protein L6452_27576 [Arctium lappa]|uniref:Uncharacterized protein n=1 Tax=Arctium lappa TaxID=4217 RepID=A0ACB8ZWD0_ARCLA|nr:hypothetical protein L6452_27576 [Arctium lappa]
MREKLLFYSIADFQVALDLGVKKVSFPPPQDSLPPSANILPNSIITSPSFGFVYLNLKGEKKLFMGIESQKYSTESLLLIQELLIKYTGTPLVPTEVADVLLSNIDATLNFRFLCVCYYRELKKEGGFGKKINDFPDAKVIAFWHHLILNENQDSKESQKPTVEHSSIPQKVQSSEATLQKIYQKSNLNDSWITEPL